MFNLLCYCCNGSNGPSRESQPHAELVLSKDSAAQPVVTFLPRSTRLNMRRSICPGSIHNLISNPCLFNMDVNLQNRCWCSLSTAHVRLQRRFSLLIDPTLHFLPARFSPKTFSYSLTSYPSSKSCKPSSPESSLSLDNAINAAQTDGGNPEWDPLWPYLLNCTLVNPSKSTDKPGRTG